MAQLYVSKRDMTIAGRKVWKGQIISPPGGVNDPKIFRDDSHWTTRYDGKLSEGETCGSDGCDAVFLNLGLLDRHRKLLHGPERDARLRMDGEAAQARAGAEARGETVGGYPVDHVKAGPRGPVPYIKPVLS